MTPLAGWRTARPGRDLAAGLTLAAVAVPEQMATARLGGFQAEFGLIAFAAASVAFAIFGANRRLSVGADTTITPIFAGGLAALAASGAHDATALAPVLALLVGALLLAAGVFRLGWIADLLSTPVISGFLAGIAAHIVISQAPSLLGVSEVSGRTLHRLARLWAERGAVEPVALAVGLATFACTLAADRLNPRIPGALLALAAATAATVAFGLDERGLAVIGRSPPALPSLAWPDLRLASEPLLGLAFVVCLVIMVQTGATTRAFHDGEPGIDRDFAGVGAANLAAGLFGAFPVNASPPRTAVVAAAGGGSKWSGLAAAAVVLAFAGFGGSLVARTPAAALAGVLLYIACRIVRLRTLAELLAGSPAEFALALATAALIVVLPIETGVAVGIFLSLIHGVFTVTRARPIIFEQVPDTTVWWPADGAKPGPQPSGVLVMGFQAPLSFLNAYDFRRGVLAALAAAGPSLRLLVLEASSIVEIDYTAAAVLSEVIAAARGAGVEFAVARLESVRAQRAFERLGLSRQLGEGRVFRTVAEAIAALGSPNSRGGALRTTT